MIHPIVVGHGRKLFEDCPTHPLELKHSERFETGVMYLAYAPASS
jgi:hypothetical protein